MDSLAKLLEIQIETLFRFNAQGRMAVQGRTADRTSPRLFLGRSSRGNRLLLRADIEPELASRLGSIAEREPVVGDLQRDRVTSTALEAALDPVSARFQGPAWVLPDLASRIGDAQLITPENVDCARNSFSWVRDELAEISPCVAVIEEDAVVSVCHSAALGPRAAEAGVETAPTALGRGLATRVAAAWAAQVQRAGRLALYSTTWDNRASTAIAVGLGGTLYAEDFHLT